ncbi:MAG: PAN domain-containing protein [Pyrinomonadaceae bacterium]
MSDKIFISYRRDDAKADARSIYQRLQRTFGAPNLFMDVDTIPRGHDFRKVLEAHLAESRVLLVVIGRNWLGGLGKNDGRRLDDPADFVRMEVASALDRDIPVIPILVEGAQMPGAADLPAEIRGLVFRQAVRVAHESFPRDMDGIERDIRALLKPRPKWGLIASGAAVLLAALWLSLTQFGGSVWRIEPLDRDQAAPTHSATNERAFTSFEVSIDMPGGDYTSLRLSSPDATLCQKHCAEDQRCLAWTYVAPGYQEGSAICWLKNIVPEASRRDVCCTSGVAYYRRAK